FMLITPPFTPPTNTATFSRNVAGRFGPAYDPFSITCEVDGRVDFGDFRPLSPSDSVRLEARRQLRTQLEAGRPATPRGLSFEAQWDQGCAMLTSPDARRVFELSGEREQVRDAYGHTTFGQSLLLTRRLVEAGVPYVWTSFSRGNDSHEEGAACGWDTHDNRFLLMADWHGPILDRALSAFLDDLHQRGLLESTLVVVMGEMGRTPKIDDAGAGGRNHWGRSGFSLWAGAGVQGGRIIGETDRIGGEPLGAPVTPLMIGTTMTELAGVDAQARSEMGVLQEGSVIDELF
ncbi:MAG: DUF1501 domain-containing protein, partial [Planctomycetota bacterium]